jgi:hypothetical protein
LRIKKTKCVIPDDIYNYGLKEFSLQVTTETKSGVQGLKETEEEKIHAIIAKWRQMEYEVR